MMQRGPFLLVSVVNISTSCNQEIEPLGALTLAASPNKVAVDGIFPRLHWDAGRGRRAGIVVRDIVVVRIPIVLSSIVGRTWIFPVEGARLDIVSSHVTLSHGYRLCRLPST
jgi:hypothetical protein